MLPPQVWPLVTKALKEYGVSCELNLVEGRAAAAAAAAADSSEARVRYKGMCANRNSMKRLREADARQAL